jgi:hypothetical protein
MTLAGSRITPTRRLRAGFRHCEAIWATTMRKIALIATTMSVALLADSSFKPAPVGKDADAELSIDPLHSAVHSVSLPTQSQEIRGGH